MSSEVVESEKQNLISKAAFEIFAEHGFRKTSMRLIAERAGMSRPALYQYFQSKEDVFGFMVTNFFIKIEARIKDIFANSGPPAQVLKDMFDAFDPEGVIALLLNSKNGHDLMEAKGGSAQGFVDKVETDIRLALTKWLRAETRAGRIVCPDPELMGQTIMLSYYGLKRPLPSYSDYKARTAQLAEVMGAGLLMKSLGNASGKTSEWRIEVVKLNK